MSEYEMKKSLRKTPGAPKSYAEPEQDLQVNMVHTDKKEKQPLRQSIFQHKNWSLKQKIKLMVFLSFYQVLSDWNSQRKSIYLYKHLSNFLKRARTPQQCKNIHSLLKRKFSSIYGIVQQMQLQLEVHQNYDRLLLKYERDMVNFQKENRLFDNVQEEQKYEPISSKRATQRQEMVKNHNEVTLGQELRQYHASQQKTSLHYQVNLGSGVKCQDKNTIFQQKRDQLIQKCNFHFKEWLLCASMIEQRRQGQMEAE